MSVIEKEIPRKVVIFLIDDPSFNDEDNLFVTSILNRREATKKNIENIKKTILRSYKCSNIIVKEVENKFKLSLVKNKDGFYFSDNLVCLLESPEIEGYPKTYTSIRSSKLLQLIIESKNIIGNKLSGEYCYKGTYYDSWDRIDNTNSEIIKGYRVGDILDKDNWTSKKPIPGHLYIIKTKTRASLDYSKIGIYLGEIDCNYRSYGGGYDSFSTNFFELEKSICTNKHVFVTTRPDSLSIDDLFSRHEEEDRYSLKNLFKDNTIDIHTKLSNLEYIELGDVRSTISYLSEFINDQVERENISYKLSDQGVLLSGFMKLENLDIDKLINYINNNFKTYGFKSYHKEAFSSCLSSLVSLTEEETNKLYEKLNVTLV